MAQSHGLGISDVMRTTTQTGGAWTQRVGRIACAIIAAIVVAMGESGASAHFQGTLGLVADPVGLVELTKLLEQNGVDYRPIYPALEAAYMKYIAAHRELRAGDIEQLEDRMTHRMEAAQFPTIEYMKRSLDLYMAVLRKAVALEESLFDGVRAALPESDHVAVARTGASRTREIWRTLSIFERTRAASVDVPAILRGLDWKSVEGAAELRGACENALGDFDARHDRLLRASAAAKFKYALDMAARTAGTARGEILTLTEAEADARFDAAREAFAAAIAVVIESQKPLRASSTRAYRAVLEVLKPRDAKLAREFRGRYLEQFYELDQGGRLVDQVALGTLRMRAMTDNQRAMIRSIYSAWSDRDDRIVDELAALLDKQIARGEGMYIEDVGSSRENRAARDVLEERRATEDNKALEAIYAARGIEAASAFGKLGSDEEEALFLPEDQALLYGDSTGLAGESAAADASEEEEERLNDWGDLQGIWVARRMELDWADRIEAALGCDEGAAATLGALMADYWAEWDAQIKPHIGVFNTLTISLRTSLEDPALTEIRSSAELEQWFSRQAELEGTRRTIEDRFFDGVGSAVADSGSSPVVQLLRAARICGDRVPGLDRLFDNIAGGEEVGNVLLAAMSVGLSPAECKSVAEALAPTVATIISTAEDLSRASIEQTRMQPSQFFSRQEYNAHAHGDRAELQLYARSLADAENAALLDGAKAAHAKANAQRAALEAIIAVIPAEAGQAVRRAYMRDAFQGACRETEHVESWLKAALALADLTPPQRSVLAIARDEFGAERDAAIEGMLKQMRTEAPPARFVARVADYDDKVEVELAMRRAVRVQRAIQEAARFAFERDVARDKLLLRLKHILTAEQLRAAGVK